MVADAERRSALAGRPTASRPGAVGEAGGRPPRTGWRFLLPRPTALGRHPVVVIGSGEAVRDGVAALAEIGISDQRDRGPLTADARGAAEPLETAESLESAESLETAAMLERVAPLELAEAVVWLRDGEADLTTVLRRMAPGAVALFEVDRRLRGRHRLTPHRLTHTARREGVAVAATYVASADGQGATRYLPLDHAGALAWCADTLEFPGRWGGSVVRSVARRAVRRFGPAPLRAVVPRYLAVLGRPHGAAGGDRPVPAETMVPAALDLVPGATWTAATRAVVVVGAGREAGRTALFPFDEGARAPTAVVQLAIGPGHGTSVYRELDRLHRWQDLDRPELVASLPQPLGWARLGGLDLTVRSAARGRSVLRTSGRPGARLARRLGDLDLVTDWAIDFQDATRRGTVEWSEVVARRLIVEPLERAAAAFAVPALEHLALDLWSTTLDLDGVEMPFVERHGDLVPRNVFIANRRLSVIGWSAKAGDPLLDGLPLMDLLQFVVAWDARARQARTRDDEVRWLYHLLTPRSRSDRLHEGAWRNIGRAGDALRLDRRVVPLLLALLWIDRLEVELTAAPLVPGAAASAPQLALVGNLEELARALERTEPAHRPWT